MWSALFLTLPGPSGAPRLRAWRALKAMGSVPLRDGVWLLPADRAALFEPVAAEARAHGGQAQVMQLAPGDDAQRQELLALFDRSDDYARWRAEAQALAAALPAVDEVEARRRLRGVDDALRALLAVDHYPGPAAEQARAELAALRRELDARFSRGEPQARPAHGLPRLDIRRYQGRQWVTRPRPWVDRLACAWLIRRFIDPQARILWLPEPARAPRGALGFDFDGARFSHVGARVSFEVLSASFGLDADPRLQRVGAAVHVLDVGGIPVPEAPGLEAVLAGLRETLADDDDLARAAAAVFDAFYAAPVAHPNR